MKNPIKTISWFTFFALLGTGAIFAQDSYPEIECASGSQMNAQSLFLNTAESAGPKYRKIGLNGFPIPDEKPQQKAESDEEPEETYIDAFNHNLTHQVTDIYVPIQGSDLTLTVRRNWAPEIWETYGLKPSTPRPDLPFGAGWKSNIGAHIKIVYPTTAYEPIYAYVLDTNGVSYRFLAMPFIEPGETKFFPMPENRYQQESLATELKQVGGEYHFTNKYGTKLKFAEVTTDTISPLCVWVYGAGTSITSKIGYGRLLQASDRYDTTMSFYYAPSNEGLIPNSITCRGKTIHITITDGRVSKVSDPKGNDTHYTYQTKTIVLPPMVGPSESATCLSVVTRADDTATSYSYQGVYEADPTPKSASDPSGDNQFFYIDLQTITDPNGNTCSFSYAYDKTRSAYMYQDHYKGWYRPAGNPRRITSVSLPNGTSASFGNSSNVYLTISDLMTTFAPAGNRTLHVTDAAGGSWNYSFTEASVAMMDEFAELALGDVDTMHKSVGMMIFYERMTVSTPEGGQMVATFDKAAGMALKSFKDVGASSATTYTHNDTMNLEFRFPWLPNPAIAEIPAQKWSDPTSQTNGNGDTKYFEYSGPWRIMSKVTDEDGRVTETEVDSSNGNRTMEEIRLSASSPVVQRTEFEYGSGSLSGVLTKTTILALPGDPSWAVNLVTTNTLEPYTGNILSVTTGTSVTHATYDENNNKVTSTDANGNLTSFVYDELNRLTDVHLPGSVSKAIRYDARGNKIRETDERGNSTLYEYDGLNRVVKQGRDMDGNMAFSALDIVTEFAYNALNAKTFVTDPRGNVTETRYDGLNRPVKTVKTIDALALETNFQYGANSGGLQFGKDFLPTEVTDPRGYKTIATYDANNRPTQKSVQYSLSGTGSFAVTKWEYDKAGNAIKVTDPLNRDTYNTYDALKRLVNVAYPDGMEAGEAYTSTGLKWKTEERATVSGVTVTYDTLTEYDNQGRPVKVFSPLVDNGFGTVTRAVTESVYDAAGNVVETINPRGYSWTFEYDSRNRKKKEIRPGTGTPTFETFYDGVGNITKVKDARGAETETTYDRANRPTEVLQPPVAVYGSGTSRPSTLTEYDKNGNVTKLTDPNGHETNNVYDELNRLRTTTDAEGIVVENEYDEVGNKTAVIDGKDQRTEFEYDGLNRNTKVIDDVGKATTFVYDAVNKTARVDSMNQRTEYGYDYRNRLISVSYKNPSGAAVNDPQNATRIYSYDAFGSLTSVTEAAKSGQADVAYTYDSLKRQISETSAGLTHVYRYDLAGNRIYCLYGGLAVPLVSDYDEQNRLSTLTQGAMVSSYTYDPNGNVASKTLPNGDVVSSVYDKLNRTTTLSAINGSSADLYNYTYDYDKAGNVRRVVEAYGNIALNRVVINAYDDINRLEEEVVTGSGAGTTSFGYDDANNRTSMVKSGTTTTYDYNSLNQLTDWNDGVKSAAYEYDDNGNRTIYTVSGIGACSYYWDYENRLIAAEKGSPEAGIYNFNYDYRSRRVNTIHSRNSFNTHKISFSGGVSVREYSGTTPLVDYVRGSDYGGGVGGILYTVRSGTASFTHNNRRGDIVAKTNAAGAITYQATYEAFGKRATETGSTQDRQKSNSKDEDIPGYANEGFRFRDLETGAFISRDPAGFVDGPNLYAYVVQNPWTSFDPDGLKRVENRVEERSVSTPTKPKRSDYKGDEKGWNDALKEYRAAEKTAKDNAEHNWRYAREIEAWKNYDKIQGMASGSSAMQQMNRYLDQEKIMVNGKEYNLIIKITMTGIAVKNGEVSPGHIEGDNYVINMDLSTSHFSNPSVTSDRANNGQVPWHALPHETYHVVEAAGIGTAGGLRGIDPLGLGTTRPGDGNGLGLIPGTKLPAHEARATRAGNLVASQTGHTEFSSHYPSKVPGAPAIPVPGYAP